MKHLILFAIMVLLSTAVFGQSGDYSPTQPVDLPLPSYPEAAKAKNLSGKISVLVRVDTEGNVVLVENITGPGAICPSVTRPDVVALRNAAADAARKAKFQPGTQNGRSITSNVWVDYNFEAPNSPAVSGDKSVDYQAPVAIGGDPEKKVVREIRGGVLNGKAVELPKPKYPAAARAVRAEGSVRVQLVIETDGTIFSAEAVEGHPLLRSASAAAACQSKFSPTTLSGIPVRVSGSIMYHFVP